MSKRLFANVVILVIGIMLGAALQPFAHMPTFAQPGCQTFPQTGKQVCGRFLDYWQKNGGLAQQGLPLSGEFTEVSTLNGKSYTVQYFERAVFEKHPENAAPYDVLLSQLGTFQFKAKYPNGEPGGTTSPQPQPTQPPVSGTNGPKLGITDYRSYKPEYSNYVKYVGIAKNTGSVQLGSAKIAATFKDAGGKIIDTQTAYGPTGMTPGDIWPFSVTTDSAKGAVSVQFQVEADTISSYEKNRVYLLLKVADLNVTPPVNMKLAQALWELSATLAQQRLT